MSPLAQSTSTGISSDALTPHLVLAIALFYMAAASNGALEDAHTRQLRTMLDGDDEVLGLAATYVQSTVIDEFLRVAPNILSADEKLCVLVNVCDVLLTRSPPEPLKLVLFDRLLKAFGLSADAFAPYYKTIVFKNSHAVLGVYDRQVSSSENLTAHVALATSLLYMMAAGGSLAAENMAQLQTSIAEFEGLQGIALAYIRRVKFNQFLPQASERLTLPQKLYVLIHACDALLSDGRIEHLERQMFQAMLTAFGYSDRSFRAYFQTLEVKHAKPEAVSATTRGSKKQSTFETRVIQVGDKTKALAGDNATSADAKAVLGASAKPQAGAVIHRSLQDNLQEVRDSSGAQANVAFIPPDTNLDVNRQSVGQDQTGVNRQLTATEADAINRQTLARPGVLGDNRQAVGVDRFDDQRVLITEEERLKDLDFIIDNLQRKIDQFERKNKKVLREATEAKLTHPPHASDEIAQISTPHHPKAIATSHLQVEKAPERILDLHNESRDWNLIWISAIVAIISFTGVMSVRIVFG